MATKIVKVISEWGKVRGKMLAGKYVAPQLPRKGYKRVEAIVDIDGLVQTKHMDVPVNS